MMICRSMIGGNGAQLWGTVRTTATPARYAQMKTYRKIAAYGPAQSSASPHPATRLTCAGAEWPYAPRTILSGSLPLYAAYNLQVPEPVSAATKVLFVANPAHCMVLSTSIRLIAATLVGGAGSILLIAAFVQTPELFILSFNIWACAFSAIWILVRHFRAYGTLLAGYMVAVVALPVAYDPLRIYDAAVARVEVVTIGITSSALVTERLAPSTMRGCSPGALHNASINSFRPLANAIGHSYPCSDLGHGPVLSNIQSPEGIIEGASGEGAFIAALAPTYRRTASTAISVVASKLFKTAA
jgi:hypothetical protein